MESYQGKLYEKVKHKRRKGKEEKEIAKGRP